MTRTLLLAAASPMLVAAAVAQTRPPAPPPPAQPQYTTAVLQGLDKTTAHISTIEAPIDHPVVFGTLTIVARTCTKAPPEDPPKTAAFLQIEEAPPPGAGGAPQRVFSGWMFAETPSLSGLENPVYDVTVLDCKSESGSTARATGK